jgi:mannose-6-phosphate isomerase-like protein (cupin superfamily)
MVRIISMEELRRRGGATRFEGYAHGSSVSFFVTNAPAGRGPDLHRHPYEETFVITDGSAVFTVDGETIEATAGTIIVVPAGAPHKFRTGPGGMRSVNIHGSDRMRQEDLE